MKVKFTISVIVILFFGGCGPVDSQQEGSTLSVQDQKGIISGIPVMSADPIAKHTVLIQFYQKATATSPKPQTVGVCTGVIVGKKSILSAAHCFSRTNNNLKNYIDVYFTQDSTDLTNTPSISAIMISDHPFYDKGIAQHFDLSMVTLEKAIPAGYEPIGILPKEIEIQLGDVVVPSGFGRTDAMNVTPNFRLNKSTGLKVVEDWGTYFLVDQSVGFGVCKGDSGGPAFMQVDGKFYLAGINQGFQILATVKEPNCRGKGIIVKAQTHKAWILSKLVN